MTQRVQIGCGIDRSHQVLAPEVPYPTAPDRLAVGSNFIMSVTIYGGVSVTALTLRRMGFTPRIFGSMLTSLPELILYFGGICVVLGVFFVSLAMQCEWRKEWRQGQSTSFPR